MIQTILVPRSRFSLSEATHWIMEHKFHAVKVDVTEHFYRFRQHDPLGSGRYYTHTLKNGIEMVHQQPF
jgi:hypothetical protein